LQNDGCQQRERTSSKLAEWWEEIVKACRTPVGTSPTADDYKEAEMKLLQQVQKDSFAPKIIHLKAGRPLPSGSCLLTLAPEFESAT